ncbi:MAG TPA: arsenosugar biosynthesis radical SAM (seleno)protein ArsS [Limnobacter sp.]|uniref:arsenosugar biosynthesis radical SAM (seleno)protein ArsS n=1 Tax=Limnobacter sp. TaxID=2003368 RepID=UPI002E34FBD6|nr:arsenosugar biosynthesis radical SAM (seleno)protein ArsS [Limnobacter sp.]HEX5487438.1 arsenosugar biosynthesis radical SAM (seleno)protein ArsS [Limnobacter sp.]
MHSTVHLLKSTSFPAVKRLKLETLQVNLGYLCNQSCTHCHVNAGPNRTELMQTAEIDLLIDLLGQGWVKTLDLTGGAPEMNPEFKRLVRAARARNVHVIDRCNLTILEEPGYEDLADFLAEQGVEVCASLPCYLEDNVDKQRGKGVFDASIAGLQKLNALGYGDTLPLNLVYNPQGPSLPPPQKALEADYKRVLAEKFGVRFNALLTITNMPIARFGSTLISKGTFASYMDILKGAFNPANMDSLMCKSLVSVDYQGNLFDCDFNQQLGWPIRDTQGRAMTLHSLAQTSLDQIDVLVGEHCYGCTAGQGSSCGGALAA